MSVNEGTTGTATTSRVLTAANLKGIINAHAPTKTGEGASGTWDIDISGNADTATVSTRSQHLETWYTDKSKTYGSSYPLYAWWETSSQCRLKVDNYTVIVFGDVNGDGAVRMNDVMKISDYIVNGKGLDSSYKIAADVNLDSFIKMNDVMKISNYIVEGGSI
jgi:hypothetical protein